MGTIQPCCLPVACRSLAKQHNSDSVLLKTGSFLYHIWPEADIIPHPFLVATGSTRPAVLVVATFA